MSKAHSFAVDNLRQYIEYVEQRTTFLYQLAGQQQQQINKLHKIVTKLKNGEEVEDDEDERSTSAVKGSMGINLSQPSTNLNPHMRGTQFNKMPQLQTLNLSGSTQIDN